MKAKDKKWREAMELHEYGLIERAQSRLYI